MRPRMRFATLIAAGLIPANMFSPSAYGAHTFEGCTLNGYYDRKLLDREDLEFNLLVAATPVGEKWSGAWLNGAADCDTCADPETFKNRAKQKATWEYEKKDANGDRLYSEHWSRFGIGREEVCDHLYSLCKKVGGNISVLELCGGIWWEN